MSIHTFITLKNGRLVILFLLATFQLAAQSEARLIKSTTSVAGSMLRSADGRYSLSQTIAQPSPITQLSAESHSLVQGFENPFMLRTGTRKPEVESRIYPNPSKGRLSITHAGLPGAEVEVKVFDLHGRLTFQQSVSVNANGECQVDIAHATSGPYQIRMSSSKKYFAGILIIL